MRSTLKYLIGQKQIEITRSALFIKEISTLFAKLISHKWFQNCCRTLVNYLNNIIFILDIISSNYLKGTQHQLRNALHCIEDTILQHHLQNASHPTPTYHPVWWTRQRQDTTWRPPPTKKRKPSRIIWRHPWHISTSTLIA